MTEATSKATARKLANLEQILRTTEAKADMEAKKAAAADEALRAMKKELAAAKAEAKEAAKDGEKALAAAKAKSEADAADGFFYVEGSLEGEVADDGFCKV